MTNKHEIFLEIFGIKNESLQLTLVPIHQRNTILFAWAQFFLGGAYAGSALPSLNHSLSNFCNFS